MSLRVIRATFECDGCSRAFVVEMDPATKRPADWTLFDDAEDCVRGGFFREFVGEKRSGTASGPELCSVQAGKHLCPNCTRKVDDSVPEDRNATDEEVERALA